MKRFVYKQNYAKLIVSLSGKTSTIDQLAREHDINAGHLRNVVDQLVLEEVLVKSRPGREYSLKLTVKGEVISDLLARLMEVDGQSLAELGEKEKAGLAGLGSERKVEAKDGRGED